MKRNHKLGLFLSITTALLLAVSAASAAPAQTFDVLLGEYGLASANAQLQQSHCAAVSESAEALDTQISVDGLYYDGRCLLIGWKTENLKPEQPVLVLYTNVRVGGISVGNYADADYPVSIWWPQAFGLSVTGDPINGLMDAFYTADAADFLLQGTQEVSVAFTVKRPAKPLVVIDADILTPYADADTETDRQTMLAAMDACGVTIASADELDVQTWMDKGYLVVNAAGEFLNTDGTTDDMPVMNGENLVDADVADIALTFTVDFDALAGE